MKKIRSEKRRRWLARRSRVRSGLGRSERVQLTVFRSSKHIYAQLVDRIDLAGRVGERLEALDRLAHAGQQEAGVLHTEGFGIDQRKAWRHRDGVAFDERHVSVVQRRHWNLAQRPIGNEDQRGDLFFFEPRLDPRLLGERGLDQPAEVEEALARLDQREHGFALPGHGGRQVQDLERVGGGEEHRMLRRLRMSSRDGLSVAAVTAAVLLKAHPAHLSFVRICTSRESSL